MSEELSFMERAQQEIADRDARIALLEVERDLYAAQAKWNAEIVKEQLEEICNLRRIVAVLQMETNDE